MLRRSTWKWEIERPPVPPPHILEKYDTFDQTWSFISPVQLTCVVQEVLFWFFFFYNGPDF